MKTQQALDRIKKVSMSSNTNEVKQALEEWIFQGGDIKDNSVIDCGYPLMHYLIIFGRRDIEFIKYLLTIGADIMGVDEYGSNILHIASALGNINIMEYCLGLKVFDINAMNNDGDTALHLAIESNHVSAARCLVQHGAEIRRDTSLSILSDKRCIDMMLYLDSIDFDFRKLYIIPVPLAVDDSYNELFQCQSIGIILQDILKSNADKDTLELGYMILEMTTKKSDFVKSMIGNHLTQNLPCDFSKHLKIFLPVLNQENFSNYFHEIEEKLTHILVGENSEILEHNDQH